FKGRSLAGLPNELLEALAQAGGESVPLRVRQGDEEAVQKALTVIADRSSEPSARLHYIQIFGEVKQPSSVPVLLKLLAAGADKPLHKAALVSLQRYENEEIGSRVVAGFQNLDNDARTAAMSLLASRPGWSLHLLEAAESGSIEKSAIPQDVVRKLSLYPEPQVASLWKKHWGQGRNP